MKLKGIGVVEQHFEKGIVGAIGLLLVGTLAAQFLFEPNMVSVGKGQPVPPGQAYRPVEEAAHSLLAKLDPRAGESLVPEAPRIDLLAQYQEKVKAGVAPRPRLAMLGPSINLGDTVVAGGDRAGAPIRMAALPAPGGATVQAYAATIDPMEKMRVKELAALLPTAQPYDKQWVSVEAVFDGTALKAALESDPDGEAGPARAVPRGWIDNAIEIIGVQIERQKLAADSMSAVFGGLAEIEPDAWGPASLVTAPPGTTDLVGELVANAKTMSDVAGALSMVRSDPERVVRPEFFSTIAGPRWIPPTEARQAEALLGGKNPVDVLRDRISEQERVLRTVERRLADAGGGGGRRPDAGGHGDGGGRPSSGGGGPGASGRPRANERQIRQLETQRDGIVTKIGDLQRQIDVIESGLDRTRREDRLEDRSVLANPSIRIWTHDLSAEPGEVYRYRVRVVINNPLYGRSGTGDEASTKIPVAYGEWSEWTDAVLVMPSDVFFVTGASPRGPASGTVTAAAECFVFYYGYYRRATTSLEPGDRVRTVAKTPPSLATFNEEVLAKRGPGAMPQPSSPRIESDDREMIDPRRPTQTPTRDPSRDPQAFDDMNGLLIPASREIPVVINDIFLDATEQPEIGVGRGLTSRGEVAAYFRTSEGRLTTRFPGLERASGLYRLVVASDQQGQTQGQPKPEPARPEGTQRDRMRRDSHGHGDGGGGGGG